MKIDVLTLFPEMFENVINTSIIKRAIDNEKVIINLINFRQYSKDKHSRVDDYQYGGGKGMVLMPEPIFDAVEDLKTEETKVILLSPQGKTYSQEMAYEFASLNHVILICGHYEGFDERILSLADAEVSIGDYVLTGGEIPAMVVLDSIVRLVDGVIDQESHLQESFNDNLLDHPVYTKPFDFRGMMVPDVLLSGHHENINKWRHEERVKKTTKNRPDLLEKRKFNEKEEV